MSFKQIIGHELPVKILKNALKEKHFGMSYLFYGPSGVGKSFTAIQFAKSLNCESNLPDDCCDDCANCRRTDSLQYPDLHWLDLEQDCDKIKIEQIRQLQGDISLRPFEGRIKVFIVNNCQSLSLESANCLLKVLEEPPADSVIVLISPSMGALLTTVVSRCRKIKFSGLRRQYVEETLNKLYKIDSHLSHYLAYYFDGRIGESIALCQEDFLTRKNDVLNKFMYTPGLDAAEDLFADKGQARQALSILISWFRDLMYIKANGADENLINQDRSLELQKEALRYSFPELVIIFNRLTKGFEYLEKNINAKLLADSLKAKIWKS